MFSLTFDEQKRLSSVLCVDVCPVHIFKHYVVTELNAVNAVLFPVLSTDNIRNTSVCQAL